MWFNFNLSSIYCTLYSILYYLKDSLDSDIKRAGNYIDLPNVLSSILLYIIAEDFLWTILWEMAWYFLLNSFSDWVDSMEADLFSEFLEPSENWK